MAASFGWHCAGCDLNVLDLFSGVGGFSLGLERAGMRTVALCEIEPFCRDVLAEGWPGVPCYPDVRELSSARLGADGICADLICGGFPCQGISNAAGAKARGLEDERSGLWHEMFRLVRELRPAWVLIENVPRLRTLGADTVLSDLAEAGYTARPLVVGAIHAGANHIRQRVWIVANSNRLPVRHEPGRRGGARWESPTVTPVSGALRATAAYASGAQLEIRQSERGNTESELTTAERSAASSWTWSIGPFEGDSLDDGLPNDVDERDPALLAAIKAYGNAVVPQITELLGQWIMKTRASHS